MPRNLWFATLLLTALGLVMGGAHVLEMPVRMGYEPEFYMRVTSTLYRYFGLVGGPVQVIALLVAAFLAWRLRGRVAFRSTLAGVLCLGLSLVLWYLMVQTVNAAWGEALQSGTADAVQAYAQLRSRWEYGHAAAFAAWLVGFALLLHGALSDVVATAPGRGADGVRSAVGRRTRV